MMPTSTYLPPIAAMFCGLLLLIGPTTTPAQDATEQTAPRVVTAADQIAMDTRLKTLESDLRCLVCQNQTLADSPSEWADGMRALIREKMNEGLDDQQIIDFLVTRYGDFVTYKPPLKPVTYVLWFGPVIVMLIALTVVFVFVRRRSRNAPEKDLDTDEERHAHDLLDGDKP